MTDDVRISTDFCDHPKTVKLERRLGPTGCWALLRLLLWVCMRHPDGMLTGMTTEDVEIACRWDGEPGRLVKVLGEVGFLEGKEGRFAIHDWAEHNPWAASRPERVKRARQAAAARWGSDAGSMPDAILHRHAGSMRDVCADTDLAMPSSPLLSSPLLSTPREEKDLPPTPSRDEFNQQADQADAYMERVRALGFRASQESAAGHVFVEELAHGADPDQMLEALARIFRWTKNGKYAPKLHEVISRWREPQHLWEHSDDDGKPNRTQRTTAAIHRAVYGSTH